MQSRLSFIHLAIFVGLVFGMLPSVYSQPSDVSESDSKSYQQPIFKKQNEKALAALNRMTPGEVKALDKKLAKALTFYYDRKFAFALPLFKEIADLVETMDIMFWIGTCAMKIGRMEPAIESFNKMLSIDPDLHRVRLELATAYFSAGRYDKAREALLRVQAASPPEPVQENIEKLLAAIDERTRKTFWSFRASGGFLFDSNVNAGPGQRELDVAGGTLKLDDLSLELSDQGVIADVYGNMTYDAGERNGWMWNTAGSLYNKAYIDYSQFDFMLLDFATGPWWVGRQDIVKLPIGLSYTEYGSDRLYYLFHIYPNYEHFFNPNFSLKGSYLFSSTDYYDAKNAELDNNTHRIELRPTLYLMDRKHILSAFVAYENVDADADRWSYQAPVLGISYITHVPFGMELFMGYQWFKRQYDAPPLLYESDREDTRHTFHAALSRRFREHIFGSLDFGYINNDSNAALFTFDQTTFSMNVGVLF